MAYAKSASKMKSAGLKTVLTISGVMLLLTGCGATPGFEGSVRKKISQGAALEPSDDGDKQNGSDATAGLKKPDLFLLKKSDVVFADRNENFAVDYQLLTKESGIRQVNLGILSFEIKTGLPDTNPEIFWQVYSLETQDILVERKFVRTGIKEDGTLTYEGAATAFESDTDKLIFSVMIKNLTVPLEKFGSENQGHRVDTYLKVVEKADLPDVRRPVILKRFN